MKITSRFLLSFPLLLSGTGLWAANELPVYQDESRPMDERVEDALSRMTTQEKINMIHAQGKFSSPGVPRLGIPDLWMSDGPHGVRAEINWNDWGYSNPTKDSITAFPALTALAATWNPTLSHDYGNALGEEALYREKDVMLGPGVNIYRTPLNGRNFEYMGEDPYLASVLVVPYIKGMQQNGVAASVKHFALNNQELWRGHINVELSDRALHEIYLPAFKSAVVDGDSWTIMGSYIQVRATTRAKPPSTDLTSKWVHTPTVLRRNRPLRPTTTIWPNPTSQCSKREKCLCRRSTTKPAGCCA